MIFLRRIASSIALLFCAFSNSCFFSPNKCCYICAAKARYSWYLIRETRGRCPRHKIRQEEVRRKPRRVEIQRIARFSQNASRERRYYARVSFAGDARWGFDSGCVKCIFNVCVFFTKCVF